MNNLKGSAALFQQLYLKAEETAAELTRPWFDKSLFSCRSTVISDYVKEAEHTWQRCQQHTQSEPLAQATNESQQQWLLERLSQQLNTLVQALYRGQPPKMLAVATAQKYALQQKQSNDLL